MAFIQATPINAPGGGTGHRSKSRTSSTGSNCVFISEKDDVAQTRSCYPRPQRVAAEHEPESDVEADMEDPWFRSLSRM